MKELKSLEEDLTNLNSQFLKGMRYVLCQFHRFGYMGSSTFHFFRILSWVEVEAILVQWIVSSAGISQQAEQWLSSFTNGIRYWNQAKSIDADGFQTVYHSDTIDLVVDWLNGDLARDQSCGRIQLGSEQILCASLQCAGLSLICTVSKFHLSF